MGELGPSARKFGKFLAASGQTLWQILPLGPVGYGWSPYSPLSAFAGNHFLISFDELIEEGLLSKRDLIHFPAFQCDRIDFPHMIAVREKILFRVADRFKSTPELKTFRVHEKYWLADYALFMAIRESQCNRPWTAWPEGLRDRNSRALEQARSQLARRIRHHEVLQYLFSRHWKKMAAFLQTLDIQLIGDIPIFVADDSVDVWANRELFFLNSDGIPSVVAGVPPDYFSATGQRWGNPLYDWAAHRANAYMWWTKRMHHTFEKVDMVRIDHFCGFENYWEIPAAEPTAVKGRWMPGPSDEFFQTLEKNLQKCPDLGKHFRLADHVIAENLGSISERVEALREACGFPGMWVLQFRFGVESMQQFGYCPEGIEKNWVVYTGTHDNDTTKSWFDQIDQGEQHRVCDYLHSDGTKIHQDLISLAMRAPAKWAIFPMQDVLGLGGTARMNIPGTTKGNWDWRVSEDLITKQLASSLHEITMRANKGLEH